MCSDKTVVAGLSERERLPVMLWDGEASDQFVTYRHGMG